MDSGVCVGFDCACKGFWAFLTFIQASKKMSGWMDGLMDGETAAEKMARCVKKR